MKNKMQPKFLQIAIASIILSSVSGVMFYLICNPDSKLPPPRSYSSPPTFTPATPLPDVPEKESIAVSYANRDIAPGSRLQVNWLNPGNLRRDELPPNALTGSYLVFGGYKTKRMILKGQILTQDNVNMADIIY